jgi:hypothetical protein
VSTTPTGATFKVELPEITRADIARFVKEGRHRRAEETDKLFRTIGHGLVRVLRAVAALPGRLPGQPNQSTA